MYHNCLRQLLDGCETVYFTGITMNYEKMNTLSQALGPDTKHLHINHCSVRDELICGFSSYCQLESLNLSHNYLSDPGLGEILIGIPPTLTSLVVENCYVTERIPPVVLAKTGLQYLSTPVQEWKLDMSAYLLLHVLSLEIVQAHFTQKKNEGFL